MSGTGGERCQGRKGEKGEKGVRNRFCFEIELTPVLRNRMAVFY